MTQDELFQNADQGGGGSPAASVIQESQGSLFDKAVLVSITISSLGVKRKIPTSSVQVDADHDMVHVSKDILDSPILKEIKKFDNATRKWIADRSLPSMFRSGVYLWPIGLCVECDEYLTQRIAERAVLVDKFVAAYNASRASAQERLKDLYNPLDYPAVDKVLETFSMSYQFIDCGTPGRLRDISSAMFEREKAKAESVWADAVTEARALLRGELSELVDHLQDRLGYDGEGNPKKFKDSLVKNMNSFLDLFQPRDISDDTELQSVVAKCRETLGGVAAKQLRDDMELRNNIKAGFDSIKDQLDSLVVTGGRKIVVDTDDEGAPAPAASEDSDSQPSFNLGDL